MATYIVIPPVEITEMAELVGTAEVVSVTRKQRKAALVHEHHTRCETFLRETMTHTSWDGRVLSESVMTMALAAEADAEGVAAAVAAVAADVKAPRTLDALGVILIDDPDEADLAAMRDRGGRVFENIRIPMVVPVAEADARPIVVGQSFWHLDKINVAAARAKDLDGSGVRIGVLDTGVDATHSEFDGKTVHFMEFDEQGRPVPGAARDAGSHGTHVSGIAAGRTAGVAPASHLAVAAVLTIPTRRGLSGSLGQILAGLNWLVETDFGDDAPLVLANASLGLSEYHDFLYPSLETARTVPGVQMIAAIGNAGRRGINRHGSPGNYDIVIGIGATDQNDTVADFSDWGTVAQHGGLSKPDLCAPGVEVMSSIPGGDFGEKSGTSMASPVVAGAAALLIQQDDNLADDMDALVRRLIALTTNIDQHDRAGAGRLDLAGT